MPAKNEIVPMDAGGPTRSTLAPPSQGTAKALATGSNADALNAQERRLRLVAAQRRHTAFQLFYALFGLALMVVQLEYLWFANTRGFDGTCPVTAGDDGSRSCPRCLEHLRALHGRVPLDDGRMILHALRVLISFSTVILLYYVYAFYAAECEIMKLKNMVPPKGTLLGSPLRMRLLLELGVFVVHPFPGLEAIDPQWPHLVVATSLTMCLRVVLVVRVVQFRNSFNSSNGWFIGALTNVDYTPAFFLKATLKNYPRRALVSAFALLLTLAGYALYVVERFLCAFAEDACCEPLGLADALWALIVTLLTIGYGDVIPRTPAGRFVAVLVGFVGTLLTAVTIAVMSTYLVLTRSEHKVNAFLKKDENRRLINDHAARAIQAYLQLRAVQRKFHAVRSKRGIYALQRAEAKLYEVLRVYRQVKRFVYSHDVSDPMDKQMTMLEMMEVNVEYIRTKIEDLSELFHTQVDKSKGRQKAAVALGGSPGKLDAPGGAAAATVAVVGAAAAGAVSSALGTTHGPNGSLSLTTANAEASAQSSGEVPTLQEANAPVSPGPGLSRLHGVPGQPTAFETNELLQQQQQLSPAALTMMRAKALVAPINSAAAHANHPDTVGARRTGPPAEYTGEIPEWALVLDASLQAILTHVARVSNEVDGLRTKVQGQMDQLQTRLGDIEKRLGVHDAFREVTRGASIRKGLTRQRSMASESNGGPDLSPEASAASLSAAVIAPTNPSDNYHLGGATRFSRTSFSSRKPSIRNFVTTKDLEDFQNSGSIE